MFIFSKKIIVFLLIFSVFLIQIYVPDLWSWELIPEYLCQIGERLYREGKLNEALSEFQKALLASPGYEPALRYIQLIQQQLAKPSVKIPAPIEVGYPEKIKTRQEIIQEELARWAEKKELTPSYIYPAQTEVKGTLFLDKSVENLQFPIEIEKNTAFIVEGISIQRFLNTVPQVLSVEKISPDQLMVEAKDLGYTYLHIWDSRQRWTLEFLVTPPQLHKTVVTLEELTEEKEGSFKLRYSMDWSLYESGRRLDELERISYYWTHWLEITGDIPYGKFDSSLSVRTLRKKEELSYFTIGLEEGLIGSFKGFKLRGFDFWPGVANLAFSGDSLRGGMFSSPAFHDRLNYTIFGGKEGYGRYTGFSPGLARMRESYVSGLHINFRPQQDNIYSASVFHGWGSQRNPDLNPYGYDLQIEKHLDKLLWGYEIAHDSETFAHLFNLHYRTGNFDFNTEFRNTDKDFRTMTGWGWRAGELGWLTNIFYKPSDFLDISGRLDIFRDRLYPNPDKIRRFNQDLNLDINYQLDQLSSLRYDYSFQNE
ncbi:MAG: tetratricopeptide repeat protein, partial [Candidatus Omnitrophica bacterium]|nr:tetratricopeptide repeat protein [Candidatus Omnitrophota bacterium]